jgi:hypothetical protein
MYAPYSVTDCNRNEPGLQSAHFQDHIICIYRPVRTTLSASETAIIRLGLQSIAPGPHSLHLTELQQAGHPVLRLVLPVLVRSTHMRQWRRDNCPVSIEWFRCDETLAAQV